MATWKSRPDNLKKERKGRHNDRSPVNLYGTQRRLQEQVQHYAVTANCFRANVSKHLHGLDKVTTAHAGGAADRIVFGHFLVLDYIK
jgi:hypothetical protein